MSRRLISTGSPFERDYGYSRAVVEGSFVFVSGTTGYDYATMIMPEDVEEQTRNCFRTIAAALEEAGASLGDLVRMQYFITDRDDAERVLKVCGDVLKDVRPAAALYIVVGLFKAEMKVEIEATALRRAR